MAQKLQKKDLAELKDELLKKWGEKNITPNVNINPGNFVPSYYPSSCFSKDAYLLDYSINAIEYHIRMLDKTKTYIINIQKELEPIDIDEKYAVQRLENAITLLERHRAFLFWIEFMNEIEKLREATTKKEMEQIDHNIHVFHLMFFDKEGYMKPYLDQNKRNMDQNANGSQKRSQNSSCGRS